MKIVIGADSFAPDVNGAARFAERLAAGLAARGHKVHVICPSARGDAAREQLGAVTVHRVPSIRYRLHRSLRVCLPWQASTWSRRLLAELQPDIVHVQSHMVVGRGLVRAADERGIPVVATNHFMPENVFGYVPLLPRWCYRPAGRIAWRDLAGVFGRAEVITAPTPRAVRLLTESTGLDAEAVSCGIDADRYATGDRSPRSLVPVILFVGRLDEEKRIDELIAAFAQVPAITRARLEIVGQGAQDQRLRRLAATLEIDDRVDFRGRIDDEELLASYQRASVFCMPGVAELQSLVTLEAMAAGKPVVAANAMALPHLVRPGYNGWLYQPGDVGDLAARLTGLVEDPQQGRRMGVHSRELVQSHTFGATLDRFEEIYARVSGQVEVGSFARAA